MKLSTTPAQDGFYFPAEFQPVSEVWLAWPERKDNWRDDALRARNLCQNRELNRGSDQGVCGGMLAQL